jgi:hypothetical protein
MGFYWWRMEKRCFYIIFNKPGLPGAAQDYFTIQLWNSPVQIDLRSKSGWGLVLGRGPTFWVAPWLGAEPGWNEEPMPNFGVMACVGPAAGRRTYIHTFIFIQETIFFSFFQRIFWSRHIWESDFVSETKRFGNRSRKDSVVGRWRRQRSFRKQIHLNRTGSLWVSSRPWLAKNYNFQKYWMTKRGCLRT